MGDSDLLAIVIIETAVLIMILVRLYIVERRDSQAITREAKLEMKIAKLKDELKEREKFTLGSTARWKS